jgi:hypothetical protein
MPEEFCVLVPGIRYPDEFMTETHGAVAVLIMDVLVTNWNGPTRTLFVVAVLGKIDTG